MSAIYDLAADETVLNDLNHPIGLALSWVGHGRNVLELGCATGYTTRLLTQYLNCKVTGVEYVAQAAERARPYCQQLVIGDVEKSEVLDQLSGLYDVILAGDILEHLHHPERVLQQLRARLQPGGCWIISVPNIAHWSVRKELLMGRFNFTERGIMDATHLRWFTRRTLVDLLQKTGYRVERLSGIYTLPQQDRLHLHSWVRRLQQNNFAPGLFSYQIIARAVVAPD
jgi:2-polyprenyl-3-methyl-5-hydroxy-6-metoxy-1,4-benzoquinol methylase